MNKVALAVYIVLFSILFIVWWPIAVIWSLNTLFNAGIPYNLQTWVATVALVSIFRVSTLYSEKR